MVSIIIPVFNSQLYLEECINSVLNQTYLKWELILVDDASTDNSRKIIEKYISLDNRIKGHFFEENLGAGIARNKGIELAKKRYIAFLDSDDYWHTQKLALQLEFMISNNITFSHTNFYELNNKNEPKKIILPPKKVNRSSLLFNNYIKTLTVIYDTKALGKIYMPNYRKRQDWGLWFNILEKSNDAYCLSKPLAYYRTSNNSLSKNKLKLVKENYNFYRRYFKKNILVSFLMMILFLVFYFYFKLTGFKKI